MADEIEVTKKVAGLVSDNSAWLVPMAGVAVLEWLRRMRARLMSSVSVDVYDKDMADMQRKIDGIMPAVEDKIAKCHQQLRQDMSSISAQISGTDTKVNQILFHLIGTENEKDTGG